MRDRRVTHEEAHFGGGPLRTVRKLSERKLGSKAFSTDRLGGLPWGGESGRLATHTSHGNSKVDPLVVNK